MAHRDFIHTCFYFPNERVLFSADFDLSVFGPWYGQQDSSIEDFISSAEKLKHLPTDIWLTGHWKWIIRDNIHRWLAHYIRQIEERDQKTFSSLEKASSLRQLYHLDLIRPSQNMEMTNLIKKSEKVMLQKHLERFEALGFPAAETLRIATLQKILGLLPNGVQDDMLFRGIRKVVSEMQQTAYYEASGPTTWDRLLED